MIEMIRLSRLHFQVSKHSEDITNLHAGLTVGSLLLGRVDIYSELFEIFSSDSKTLARLDHTTISGNRHYLTNLWTQH